MNPLSAIYGASVWVRNRLYDRGILQSRRLSRPVISVGNISVGGSGKTPFVILLGELLKKRGITFDVLSRGYGRKSRGVFVVDPNGSSQEFGDEPILIAKRLGCSVVVGESRYQAGLLAEAKFKSQLHILDDGFQHRSLARDFDIVLVTSEDLQDRLLPMSSNSGWKESKSPQKSSIATTTLTRAPTSATFLSCATGPAPAALSLPRKM